MKIWIRTAVTCAASMAMLVMPTTARADEAPVRSGDGITGLTSAQRQVIESFASGAVSVGPAARPHEARASKELASVTAATSGSRTASYYRGSALMWTRDSVDFSFNWSRLTRTSAYQTAGWIWPNIARNRGITKYYHTARNDRFRAVDTVEAGVPTPWGDVKVFAHDVVNRISVNYNGAWSAWSD